METSKQFGKAVAVVRLKKSFRQQELGRMLNSGQAWISQVERGEQNLTLETVDKIAEALGYRVDLKLRKLKKKSE
jgi:transcriptional regulator with XRE-family HTH domain